MSKKNKKSIIVFAVLITATLFVSLLIMGLDKNLAGDSNLKNINNAKLFEIQDDEWVEETLSKMTTDEKVGQLIFPYAYGRFIQEDSDEFQRLKSLITQLNVGGFVFFRNNVYEQAVLTNNLQKISKYPLLIAADFESGLTFRAEYGTSFPLNMALGAADDSALTYEMGKIIAYESRAMGVHQNYAPVSDINNNPMNPIINVRSFGEDPKLVTRLSDAIIKGLQDGGMIATSKHFPGHGNTTVDSHRDLAVIHGSKDELKNNELLPFISNINNGVMSVMLGHLGFPAYDDSTLPATLSEKIVSGLLKKDLGFNGLIVTDAMNMHAITKYFSQSEAAVLAFKAGADAILFPQSEVEAYDGILRAVYSGEISGERLNYSVRKILLAKKWAGLNKNRIVDVNKIPEIIGRDHHKEIADRLAQKSITLVRNDEKLIPIIPNKRKKYFHISLLDNNSESTAKEFSELLRDRIPKYESQILPWRSKRRDYQNVLRSAKNSNVIILSVYLKFKDFRGTLGLNEHQDELIKSLVKLKKPIILLSHGNPYILMRYPRIKTYMCNFGDQEVSQRALAQALFGEIDIEGKLPISIPNTRFQFGHSVKLNRTALEPFDNLKREEFSEIEKMMNNAIKDSIFPGGQLLIAKNGEVLFEKGFGNFTYDKSSTSVNESTIYDLASVSKVIATTTAAMICIDRKLFKLDDKVSKYLPKFNSKGKNEITIRNLLLHNSGLPSFKPFYKTLSNANQVLNDIYNSELEYKIGTKTVYSDLGMIALGKIIEKVSGKSLNKFCRDEIFLPLNMNSTFFKPADSLKNKIAPTEFDNYWRNRLLQGEVHDEAASILNGVAGHAGLFSNAMDIAKVLQMLLQNGFYNNKQFFKSETINLFTTRQNAQSTRGLGWDTKSETNSSAGNLFSKNSFGHTGFTGTSVWVDPERKLFVVLLTNRVHPTRENTKIIKFRPKLHDAIIEALEK